MGAKGQASVEAGRHSSNRKVLYKEETGSQYHSWEKSLRHQGGNIAHFGGRASFLFHSVM